MRKHEHEPQSDRVASQGAGPQAPAASARPRAADALSQVAECDLLENWRFWSGKRTGKPPADPATLRRQVLEWLGNPVVVEARVATLPRRLLSILDATLECQRYQTTAGDLLNARHLAYMSAYDLQASLAVLARHALLVEVKSTHATSFGSRAWAVPQDIGDAILRRRRARQRGIFDVFTLRGHIDRMYEDPARAARTPAARVRELYKMYANEASAVARLERMADPLKAFLAKSVLEFGGIVPKSLYDRMDTIGPWDGRRWGHAMEESLVGTVERLELGRYGIAHNDETLLVFNEVALAWLRRVAVPGDPDKPHEEASYGVDLVSNISRFIAYVLDHDVRFTTRGEIFKTTERRIESELIPNPGRELSRADTLAFIYRFARDQHLIDSTGERTFALTHAGRDWEPRDLEQKVRALLEYCIEERDLPGEHYHQARMRRIYMRLLKRVEPGVWYDLMYVPFLARNTYLCSLDDLAVDEYFAARFQSGQYVPMDDVQRLSWHLVTWVRQRLYLLGIVDLGYDKAGHPVAMRVTRLGARLLGIAEAQGESTQALGNLVVTPDFEVVLFPTGDDAELVHDLDRFCTRESKGSILKFKIEEKSVARALHEGMHLKRILATLEQHSRTPVPNNVLYTVRDWARGAGVLHLDKHCVVSGDDPEALARFRQDPGVRPLVREVLDERRVKLKGGSTQRRLQSLLRELGWLVEIEE
jgi:hypothetical protein